jgi:hypothetical protein
MTFFSNYGLYPRIHRWVSVSSNQAYLGYCVTPSNYGLNPRTHRWESVSHPGLPGVLGLSVKLRTLPQDTSLRERVPSRHTWCIASLRQTTDFYPRIHRWESVSRRTVWPRWHYDVVYTFWREACGWQKPPGKKFKKIVFGMSCKGECRLYRI